MDVSYNNVIISAKNLAHTSIKNIYRHFNNLWCSKLANEYSNGSVSLFKAKLQWLANCGINNKTI